MRFYLSYSNVIQKWKEKLVLELIVFIAITHQFTQQVAFILNALMAQLLIFLAL